MWLLFRYESMCKQCLLMLLCYTVLHDLMNQFKMVTVDIGIAYDLTMHSSMTCCHIHKAIWNPRVSL